MRELQLDDAPKIYFLALLAEIFLSFLTFLFSGDVKTFIGYFIPQLVYIAVTLSYLKIAKIEVEEAVPYKGRISVLGVLLALCVTVGIFGQNLFISTGFAWVMELAGVTMNVEIPALDNAGNVILSILLLCVLPAVGEEMVFRGVFLSALKKSRGKVFAVVISSLIFALSHLNPAQFVHQFILGIVLSYITLISERIVYAMIIHFTNNVLALICTFIPEINELGIMSGNHALILAGTMLVGALILYPSLFALTKTCACDGYSKEDRNIFKFLFKKREGAWLTDKSGDRREYSYWLIALIVALTLTLIANTVVLSVPALGALA